MSTSITFSNPGEIDPRLISIMGCNVKESDSPIGFFGTGLKYALAVLAREEQQVTIWIGYQRYDLTVQVEQMRGKDFRVCYLQPEGAALIPLGFTTELGKQWSLDNAYRELFCNAKDEGGGASEGAVAPLAGHTTITVTGAKFYTTHLGRGKFLLEFSGKRKLFELAGVGAIYEGQGDQIFYKGVAVGPHWEGPAKFTYALENGIVLSEDRLIKDESIPRQQCCRILSACTDEAVVKHSIYDKHGAERYFWFSFNRPGDTFLGVAHEMMRTRRKEMNQEAATAVIKYLGDVKQPRRVIEPNSQERAMLASATEFWLRVAEIDLEEYPITLVAGIESHSASSKALALAEDGTIWITPECFSSDHMLRTTLVEEWIHLKHRVCDETRDMQNVLFDYMVKIGERQQRGVTV